MIERVPEDTPLGRCMFSAEYFLFVCLDISSFITVIETTRRRRRARKTNDDANITGAKRFPRRLAVEAEQTAMFNNLK